MVVVPAGKLVTVLAAGDGLSTAELADQTGGDRQQLLTLLRELEASGQVRRSGERRNTRWHAITDEDRIAARVAELEAQSRQAGRAA
jgi:predicted transcriptional regulator